jgi:copper homeostasis protein
MTIEVCAYSLESCWAAHRAKVQRIELCSSPFEGGTTPSIGLVTLALAQVSPEIHVMIRPRGGDFCYSDLEFEVMKQEILMLKTLGVNGFVLGILSPNGQINMIQTKELAELARPLPVTFHRAFDMTPNPQRALEDVIETGCVRILTAGQQNQAKDGIQLLKTLIKQANKRIEIMAGSGVNAHNAQLLAATGVDALHLSGKATRESIMEYRKAGISMGGLSQVPEYEISYSDVDKILSVKKAIENHG